MGSQMDISVSLKVVMVIVFLVGCRNDNLIDTVEPPDVLSEPTATAIVESVPDEPQSSPSPQFTPTPHTEITLESDTGPYAGWYRFTHLDYGFSFAFPSDWELTHATRHYNRHIIYISPQTDPEIKLVIGIRSEDEDVHITRTGVPAGDLVLVGKVPFGGQEVEKYVLVYEGKNKAILYNMASEFSVNHMVFTLSVDDFEQTDFDAVEIPKEVENTADKILESFALVE